MGSLYQYFPSKDSLLGELLVRHHKAAEPVLDRALTRLADPSTPLESGLRQLLEDLVAMHQANPALTRALSTAVISHSTVAEALHKEDDHHQQHVIAVLARRPDVRAGDHLAMALVLEQATGQLRRWLVHDAPPVVKPGVLLEEIVQLLTRFLRADG